jgi:amidase
MQQFLSKWDVWMCPVAGCVAFPHRRTGSDLVVDGKTVPYAAPLGVFNTGTALAGTPCVVLPIGTSRNGLPIGVQMHARRWEDAHLLDVAASMEEHAGLEVQPVDPTRTAPANDAD